MLKVSSSQLANLFFPDNCPGCGTAMHQGEKDLCIGCLFDMPFTRMHDLHFNSMEMRLHGRFPFTAATALLFFMKDGKVQRMIHRLKYHGDKEIGRYLGRMLAQTLQGSARFADIDWVVPVPLHPRKRKARGFNQVDILAQGMEERGYISAPHALRRVENSVSQTSKNMMERWENVNGIFALNDVNLLRGKKVLLLDDVLTTGATLEACASELMKIEGIQLYVATIACAEY